MKTRSQARWEQTSQKAASFGVDSPGRRSHPLQGNADVASANDHGGSQATAACREGYVDRNRGSTTRNRRIHVPRTCDRQWCATCRIFNEDSILTSTITGRRYAINNRNCELNCTTENIAYLTECNNCHIQYVGETSQKMSDRFSDHKSRIRKHNSTKKVTLLIDYFNFGPCKDKDYSAKIIKTLRLPARKNGKLDPHSTTQRKREDYCMEELHTIYPYGLNNRHGMNLDQHCEDEAIRTVFHKKSKNKIRALIQYKDVILSV